MDATTLATGFATTLSGFGTAYGPLILTIAGFALGIYGVRFVYGLATQWIRARSKA